MQVTIFVVLLIVAPHPPWEYVPRLASYPKIPGSNKITLGLIMFKFQQYFLEHYFAIGAIEGKIVNIADAIFSL
jgi:hypothetical protein